MWDLLWSRARAYLRLTDEEFFSLTPRQFHLLLERQKEQVAHQELLAGIIAATTANHSMNPPKRALGPGDFMPSERARKKPERMNRRQIADQVRIFLTARLGVEH